MTTERCVRYAGSSLVKGSSFISPCVGNLPKLRTYYFARLHVHIVLLKLLNILSFSLQSQQSFIQKPK